MAVALAPVRPRVRSSPTVVTCYDFFDRVFPQCGLVDYTEGKYYGDSSTPYEQAQRNQVEWLLDQADCGPGSRLLDIGCGNGTLLAAAQERGAEAVGITISPPQVERCRRRGLDVRLLDYRALDAEYEGRFDAVIANGSAEHFVQPADARAGRADDVYRDLFATVHRALDPLSASRRFVTTIIHLSERMPRMLPDDWMRSPFSFRWGSEKYHYALLRRGFGGSYPELGQLERCAAPHFDLVDEEDGTEDYRLTSEQWFDRVKRALVKWSTGRRIWPKVAGLFVRHPRQTALLTWCLLVAQSWQHQFRGPRPPMTLLRQTWQAA